MEKNVEINVVIIALRSGCVGFLRSSVAVGKKNKKYKRLTI